MPAPLSERLRPTELDQVIGQEHLTGPSGVLSRIVAQKMLPSLILWGPPGTGKTTLAQILAQSLKRPMAMLSAISSGVKEVREVIDNARRRSGYVLFIDEIHRFNKAQQDALLGAVERGVLTLIGATTENPSFEVNAALLSRCQVYTLNALTTEALLQLVQHALATDALLQQQQPELKEHEALLSLGGGDARKTLNLLELTVLSTPAPAVISNELVKQVAQQRTVRYDKAGEQHYDIISAFIKSLRGSDPNAAVYWLTRMIEGGEEVKFIARRLVIFASEDIGNANPTALVLATAAAQAVQFTGYPEASIVLAQAVTYLASSAKSNASYMALKEAQQLVKETGDLEVPLHLRNAPTKLMKQQGYGSGYQYPHNYPGNFAQQEYLPQELAGKQLYSPGDNPRERELRKFLQQRWKEKYGY
jgi:putative ATPase